MKKPIIAVLGLLLLGAGLLAVVPADKAEKPKLELGEQAPMTDYKMKDVSGEMTSLKEVSGETGLLVVFSCNTCPWVKRWEDRFNPIANLAEENGIGVIFPNPNAAARDEGDGYEDMVQRAENSNYQFPYVLDENSELALAFGATHTPDVFLFNSDMELVYKGAIDDNAASAEEVEEPWLQNAIENLANGREINPKSTKALGCTIKFPES